MQTLKRKGYLDKLRILKDRNLVLRLPDALSVGMTLWVTIGHETL